MLDIPMLQPTPKAERAERPAAAKEASTSKSDDKSDVGFEAAYADEAADETPKQAEETVESDSETSGEAQAKKEEAGESDEGTSKAQFGDLEEDEMGLVAAPQPSEKNPAQSSEKKPGTDTLEAAFAQQVKSVKASEGAAIPPKEQASTDNSLTKATGAKPAPDASNAVTEIAANSEKQTVKNLDHQSGAKLSEKPVGSSEGGQNKNASTATLQQQQAASGAVLNSKSDSISRPRSDTREKTDEEPRLAAASETARPKPVAQNGISSFSTTPTVTSQPMTQLSSQVDLSGLEMAAQAVGDPETPTLWDARTSSPAALAQVLSRPETPAMIGRQMAEFLQRLPDRPVELSLNPEELGRVRLSISVAEGGITVSVLAERPETLDLMRRHIDQLAREFQTLGYENIGFAFNEGQSGEESQGDGGEFGSNHSNTAGEEPTSVAPVSLAATSGVDMRL